MAIETYRFLKPNSSIKNRNQFVVTFKITASKKLNTLVFSYAICWDETFVPEIGKQIATERIDRTAKIDYNDISGVSLVSYIVSAIIKDKTLIPSQDRSKIISIFELS